MLHVTNGDSAINQLREGGIQEPILAWQDVLHDGPVPAGANDAELRTIRARFIAERGWGEVGKIERTFAVRDQEFDAALNDEEIVLWFEHDLYDQLQLMQIIERIARAPRSARVTLVCGAEYVGNMTGSRVRELLPLRAELTEEQRQLGTRGWDAVRAAEPTAMLAMLAANTAALPFLGAALRRLLEELPSAVGGISRTERQALEVLASGPQSLKDLYPAAHHKREEAIYLGDSSFVWHLERMSHCAVPLVLDEAGERFRGPTKYHEPVRWDERVAITPAGTDVLAGKKDNIALNDIDRWIGGTWLKKENDWRWDGARAQKVGAG